MEWLSPFSTLADGPLPDPGIPRRLLRELFESRQIGAGSRVLDVGCGRGELLQFLDQLCLDVSGLDASPDNVEASRSRSPNLTCLPGTASEPLPFPEQHFNLILARDLSEHAADLFGPLALCATARLLAAIRPGGILCIIHRLPPAINNPNEPPLDHGERCFQRHLEAFADDVKLSQIGDSWNWLARFTPKSRYLTATAFLPPEPVTLNEWLRMALKTAHGETAVCCAAAARIARASLVRRSA